MVVLAGQSVAGSVAGRWVVHSAPPSARRQSTHQVAWCHSAADWRRTRSHWSCDQSRGHHARCTYVSSQSVPLNRPTFTHTHTHTHCWTWRTYTHKPQSSAHTTYIVFSYTSPMLSVQHAVTQWHLSTKPTPDSGRDWPSYIIMYCPNMVM